MTRTTIIATTLATTLLLANIITRANDGGADLRVTLATNPEWLRKGIPVTLILEVRDSSGNRVQDLPLVHERPMHLIIAPADLSQLTHLHPARTADGRYATSHVFTAGGRYRVYADLRSPDGHAVVVPFTLDVQGDAARVVPIEKGLERGNRAEVQGIRAERVAPQRITSGAPVELGFALSDARSGGPVRELQPYLGTMAHVIIISADGKEFLHAHTMDGGDHGGHGMHMEHGATTASEGATTLKVHTAFPRPGIYRIWMQVQRRKQVVTLPFAVRVE